MLEDYLNAIDSFNNDGANPVTRKKPDDWTFWAIIIAFGGIAAILIMGLVLFGIMTLA